MASEDNPTDSHASLDAAALFAGPGEVRAVARELDWSQGPLGPTTDWSPAIRTMVRTMFDSPFPICLWSGLHYALIYNDAYRRILAAKHPAALGLPGAVVWAEIWEELQPQFDGVRARGEPVYHEDAPFVMARLEGGGTETAWFNYSLSPLRDEDGSIAAVLNITPETSSRVLLQRHLDQEQAALALSEDRLRSQVAVAKTDAERVQLTLAAGAIIGTWFWNLSTDQFTVDEAFATAFGLDPALGREGIPLAQIVATVHPDDQAGLAVAINHAISKGGRYAHQYRVRRRNGRYHWLEANGHVEHGPDGTPLRFPGVLIDVEERRAVEAEREHAIAALRELNADLERKVLERSFARGRTWQVSPDLLVVIGGNGCFESVNPAWTATLGWSEKELTQSDFLRFVHPQDLVSTQEAWADASERRLPVLHFRNRYRHKDGGWRWLAWVAVPDEGKVYGSARDVTLEVEQAIILKESQQTNKHVQAALAAGAIIGTWNWNFEDDFFTFDEGFAFAFGHDLSSAQTGLPIDEVLVHVHPEDRPGLNAAIAQTIERGGAYARQYRVRRADGNYYWIEANGRVEFDAAGKSTNFPGFIIDVDERVSLEAERDRATAELRTLSNTLETRIATRTAELMQAEESLRQSQKMEAVGQLTGGLAHDFNNLLTAVTGGLEMLAAKVAKGEYGKLDRYIAMAQTGANRAAALTQRLLAFSRRQTLAPIPTDVDRLIASMEEMIDHTLGPEFEVKVVSIPGLWPVLVDAPQLENALLNLGINARDAMPDGGLLTIETSNERLDARAAADQDLPEGEYVSICVTDTGIGMPPEVIARVFDPFFTTKPIGQGTGLGLSMIYGFVRQSGGQVCIYSEVGKGTTMCLYLPRYLGDVAATEQEAGNADAGKALPGETILIVEDETAIRQLVADVLSDAGYRVLEAPNGPAGVKLLQSEERIDLLITDVGLPGGLNGRQVADAGRVVRPALKVLFVTGYAANAAVGAGHLDEGMQVLTKPFNIAELEMRIREMIGSESAALPS
ncbi:PAS domain-containing hybrid sensor histidine kinase/response regulator [Xanthomonas arboricola]|uniref:PAS domain-containing hybrid sensor histidine kinase/response regulator n=1 Tax=Xanthomonas arboricola TaxID=56448 RepID=UPI0017C5E39F|nr:PAS domain-containing hybrid sensor histidine kinase/response regulator [Xanthomonas arboricola]MBB3848767.1 PAS domain S-box-containing protein [Xanthomonas arboricola]